MCRTFVSLIFLCAPLVKADGFDLLLAQGMAPCAIHVKADIDPHDTLTIRPRWDFGDPKGAHNLLVGFNAAHLYIRPGQYSITLTETIGDVPKTFTKKIFVAADRRRSVFVSSHGSDIHTGLAEGNAVRSLSRAMNLIGDGATLLLHRGDVFDVDNTLTFSQRNIVIGAYGDGTAPVLRSAALGVNDLISTTQTASDVVIRDIAFDSATPTRLDKDGAPRAVHVAGTNIALDHLTFLNVCDASNCEAQPRGFLMQDCTAPAVTSLRGYLMWGAGSQLVVIGCTAGNSTREHIIRLGGADHVLIANNDFANIARGNSDDAQDIAKGTLVLQKCAMVYAVNNTLRHGNLGIGPLEGVDGAKDPLAEAQGVVLENNTISAGNINIHPGAHDVCIRDNVIHLDEYPAIIATPTDATKLENGQPAYPNRNISSIQILRNTVTNDSRNGTFFLLHAGARPGTVTLVGNRYIAPHWVSGENQNAAVYVEGEDLNSFAAVRDNVWPRSQTGDPSRVFYVWPTWYDARGYRGIEEWGKWPQVKGDKAE